jgi:hypothetical protein
MGGLTVRVFAREYPTDVAGVVLIESMSPSAAKPSSSTATESELHCRLRVTTSFWEFCTVAGEIGDASILGPIHHPRHELQTGRAPAPSSWPAEDVAAINNERWSIGRA